MGITSSRLGIGTFLVTAFFLVSSGTAFGDTEGPTTELSPQEVVRIQLDALKNNGPDNDGIEHTFRFASPANRESTGPLERFAELFETPAYEPMLNHLSSELLEPIIDEKFALVPVVVSQADGSMFNYVFVLSKQSVEPYEDMWMTDGVRFRGSPTSPGPEPESII